MEVRESFCTLRCPIRAANLLGSGGTTSNFDAASSVREFVDTPAGGLRIVKCHVLQVTQDLGHGGLERVAATIGRNLDPDRFRVSFLALREGGPRAEELRNEGFRVDVLPGARRSADYLSSLKVARYMRQHQPDVVHTHNTHALIDGGLGALFAGRQPLVHTDHARPFPDRIRYVVAENLLSRLTFRMVGVSEHTTENLRRYERIPSRKLTTIPNGVDVPALDRATIRAQVRSELDIPADQLVIGTAVRLAPQKALTYLIEAFARLGHSFPNASLVLAGTGPDRESLAALAAKMGVGSRVRFLGLRHDVPRLLCAYDVFALSSVWEGMPLGVLEAMALRCPVVATSVGGIPELIEHGHSGLLVTPRAVDQLEAAIGQLLREPATASAMADRALKRFHDRFSLRKMIGAYESLYLAASRDQ
jgi:glycosyltransferase involved in cell wall biosynthesis